MDPSTENRPLTQLLATLGHQVQRLIATEVQLARAEVKENLAKSRSALGLALVGLVLLLPALTIFLQGIVNALLIAGIRSDLAALGVGIGVGGVSILLILAGLKKAKAVNLVPEKAISHLQRDVAAVNPVRPSDEYEPTRSSVRH